MLGSVRSGKLPLVSEPTLHLPTDEHCYLTVPATRRRPLRSGLHPAQGQLIVTNRKIRFAAIRHGGETQLSKVLRVALMNDGDVLLEATTHSVSGRFTVADPEWVEAVVDTALRIDRRLLLTDEDRSGSRRIPQHIKIEVWQRDRGCCAECGAGTYLEFDHVIPWSKGGASTVNNVQLLCRRCNLKKSDRL
jgi:HNH endonuclease